MVFDVESVGLHGEGFAVGFVVVDSNGSEKASVRYACAASLCKGTKSGGAWVKENVPWLCLTHDSPHKLRRDFWAHWRTWKEAGAILAADCLWPVEARFLAQCVDDEKPHTGGGWESEEGPRDWEGPYPFIDVASVRMAAGFDPLGTEERRPNELPAHDPLCDARQSARLLIEALQKLRKAV